MLLCQSEDANCSFRLAQMVVDADEGLNCSFRAAGILMLLVVQRLGKGMALLGQRSQCSAVQKIAECEIVMCKADHSSLGAAGILMLLVVERLGKGMALLSQRFQCSAVQQSLRCNLLCARLTTVASGLLDINGPWNAMLWPEHGAMTKAWHFSHRAASVLQGKTC